MANWSASSSRIRIEAVTVPMGDDLCVVITGGDRPHLGAVGLGEARGSISVLTIPGHREDVIVQSAASKLAARLGKNVVVCCGIHVDHITKDEIEFVIRTIDEFCESF